ncbi:MAG: chemotaxis protein CheW, partial [Gammaproteobacteria bacterium]|nr:chemotaxis protein CheW [Gammaproteobacteria bacterium]
MVEFEDEQSLLIFQVGSFTFCVPAEEVTAIIQPPELTSLPLAPEYIMGTFMFRGEVATAISLRNKFKLTESDSKLLQLIVTRVGGNIAAFCVDAVDDIISASSVKWDDAKGMFESEAITRYAIYKSKILFMTQFINLFEVQAAERFTKMARDLVHSNGEALAQSAEQDSQIVSAAEEASLVGYATPSAIESHTDIEDQGIVENEAAQEAEWGLYSSIENTESDQAEQSASASVIESNEQEEAEWGLYSTVEANAPDQTPGA